MAECVARTNQPTHADAFAYSVPEFCCKHNIGRAHFYNVSRFGNGLDVMRVRRRTLISAEAAEWRRRMEQGARDAGVDGVSDRD